MSDFLKSVWLNLGVPETVVQGLLELGFDTPTPIQASVLPPAIKGRCDILGAAQTGSGKTLAYGLPLLRHVLDLKQLVAETAASCASGDDDASEKDVESDGDDDDHDTESGEDGTEQDPDTQQDEEGCGLVYFEDDVPDEEFLSSMASFAGPVADIGEVEMIDLNECMENESAPDTEQTISGTGVLGLVLTPTRELALQVLNHLQAVAKHTDVNFVALVGGMATQKQERLLTSKKPEVVIATPGRLWGFLSDAKNAHLETLRKTLRWLVIDEADRMISQGHFAELELILSALPSEVRPADGSKPRRRQTLLFSATLTMVPSKVRGGAAQSLQKLAEKACVAKKPKVIDLTKKTVRVGSLKEARLMCSSAELKDIYLYHFLLSYPGRTIVFCNSIDCVHRLCALFALLRVEPLRLHANMQQRQRLKNLERFAAKPKAVLVASDVAARGLDVKNVDHVIHYQVCNCL